MRTIHKFPMMVADTAAVSMPANAVIRHVGSQHRGGGVIQIWAEVDTDDEPDWQTFYVRGTGHPVPDVDVEFVATVIDGPFVWHVWRPRRIAVEIEAAYASPSKLLR